jgi:hypothetical protein
MLVSQTLLRRGVQRTGDMSMYVALRVILILRGLATRRLGLDADVSSEFAADATEIGSHDLVLTLLLLQYLMMSVQYSD